MEKKGTLGSFRLDGRVAIVTGGAGLLGERHGEAIAEAGGVPVLWDINGEGAAASAEKIEGSFRVSSAGMRVDITDRASVAEGLKRVVSAFGRIDILVNNAANDPKVDGGDRAWTRFENYPEKLWERDMAVGLKGSFLCSQVVGSHMASAGGGVIVNIASDLSVISPDQRLYRVEGVDEESQPVKPVSYSVVKHGIIGLTKYLATYWAGKSVRVNALSPGGVYNGQPDEFVERLAGLIPMGRMAGADEYKAAILFLCSDASSYMTGQNLIIDGGRTAL